MLFVPETHIRPECLGHPPLCKRDEAILKQPENDAEEDVAGETCKSHGSVHGVPGNGGSSRCVVADGEASTPLPRHDVEMTDSTRNATRREERGPHLLPASLPPWPQESAVR